MRAGGDAQAFARPIADIVGLTAADNVVRYGGMSLSFLFLGVAAYLFAPGLPAAGIGSLTLAFALVFFTIYWWFVEEARKRRVMRGTEQPREQDAQNPDLRDEVLFACAALLLLTPL